MTPSDELAVGDRVGEFRIERKLREGGMATVYAATHATTGLRAALERIPRGKPAARPRDPGYVIDPFAKKR